MTDFVKQDSIVRTIWGKADMILFIFAGAAAEFALNKAVDWLYFTGKLPADPLGRLFSTVEYARRIVFSKQDEALTAIAKISAIHQDVEHKRGTRIPGEAYHDVLSMLIDYSIRSYELLERPLTGAQKGEVYRTFLRVGLEMGLRDLPPDYHTWLVRRQERLSGSLIKSGFTHDLYKQYEKHLGKLRFSILKQGQLLVVPPEVKSLLFPQKPALFGPVISLYRILSRLGLSKILRNSLMPGNYRKQVIALDR
jgi:hypothetical protein